MTDASARFRKFQRGFLLGTIGMHTAGARPPYMQAQPVDVTDMPVVALVIDDFATNRDICISCIDGQISINGKTVYPAADAAGEDAAPFQLSLRNATTHEVTRIVHTGKTVSVNGEQVYPPLSRPE